LASRESGRCARPENGSGRDGHTNDGGRNLSPRVKRSVVLLTWSPRERNEAPRGLLSSFLNVRTGSGRVKTPAPRRARRNISEKLRIMRAKSYGAHAARHGVGELHFPHFADV
jgi:hypothetical protein